MDQPGKGHILFVLLESYWMPWQDNMKVDYSPVRPLKGKIPMERVVIDSENKAYEYYYDEERRRIIYTWFATLIEDIS